MSPAQKRLIARAIKACEEELSYPGAMLSSPDAVKQMLILRLAGLEHEVFGVLWLNSQHQLITVEEMFRGSLNQTSVHPREVVKSALAHNAAACILFHNHPSGANEPSTADRLLTDVLCNTLGLVEVKVLDHFIVAGTKTYSFAERGLL